MIATAKRKIPKPQTMSLNDICDLHRPVENIDGNTNAIETEGHHARNGGPLAAEPAGKLTIDKSNAKRILKSLEASNGETSLEKFLRLSASSMAFRVGNTADVLIHTIGPNPFQPRKEFSSESLRELSGSLAQHGLLHRIILRPNHKCIGAFEIVAGERRWRAAQLAGWRAIAAEIRDYTDEQIQALALVENDDRRDLNPLERAQAYQKLLDTRGLKPVDLESILNRSQAFISNHLRLLKLPEAWRNRVAAGEISLTHARAVMPWAKYPTLMAAIDKEIKREKNLATMGSRDFDNLVHDAIHYAAAEIPEGNHYSHTKHCAIPPPKLTDEQREQLQIIELGETEEFSGGTYAVNVKLWRKIWEKHEREYEPPKSKAEARAEKKLDAKKLSPAEQKQLTKKRAEQLKHRLSAWLANWRRHLIAQRLRTGAKADEETMFRVMLWAAGDSGFHHKQELVAEAIEAATGVKQKRNGFWFEIWQPILSIEADKLPDVFMAFARSLLWRKIKGVEQPNNALEDHEVNKLAAILNLDLAAEWKERKAGPLTQAYFNLFDKAQLEKMAKGVVPIFEAMDATKSKLVEALAKAVDRLPKEISAIKDAKR